MKINSDIDTYYVNLILFKVTYAIDKMVNCYDNNKCNFYFSNTKDVDSWFEKLYKLIDVMNNEMNRRATKQEDLSKFPYQPKYVLNGVGDILNERI